MAQVLVMELMVEIVLLDCFQIYLQLAVAAVAITLVVALHLEGLVVLEAELAQVGQVNRVPVELAIIYHLVQYKDLLEEIISHKTALALLAVAVVQAKWVLQVQAILVARAVTVHLH